MRGCKLTLQETLSDLCVDFSSIGKDARLYNPVFFLYIVLSSVSMLL